MLKDIHLRFSGFHGSAGRCQIRFARRGKNMPLVIVCSQYKNYYGTSVTNALEIIAETLFYQIATNQIDGVGFDFSLPTFEIWHDDVNIFDKMLSKLFPQKYGNRFLATKLNISAVFKNVVWIENYPVDQKSYSFEKRYSIVTLDKSRNPVWHGRPSDNWLIDKTGFKIDELLPLDEILDLELIESQTDIFPRSEETLRNLPGYQLVRWTKELVEFLPALLTSARAVRGRNITDDVEEMSIHDEIEQFLTDRLPARELFKREFPFSKELGIHEFGKEKACDFAIFSPEGGSIDSIVEVKRTSSKSQNLRSEVIKDIARLLILSKKFRCSCYLLVCGNMQIINNDLANIDLYISLLDKDDSRDRMFSILPDSFDSEYKELLRKFQLLNGSSRLQGVNYSGPNGAMLWQIAGDGIQLSIHRPYEFQIIGITEARRSL